MGLETDGGAAAYAPANAITRTIDRYRDTGFAGQPITDVALRKIGVTESLVPRTLASLRILDLIDDDGKPTDQFDVLKNASTAEFKERLGEWLRATYAPIFGFCDPTTADAAEIEDAFRGFTPEGQRSRMANLFMGLLEYAGVIDAAPPKPRGRHAATAARAQPTGDRSRRKKQNPSPVDKPEDQPRRGAGTLDESRARYIDMLMQKASGMEDVPAELLDRIERALGIAPTGREGSS